MIPFDTQDLTRLLLYGDTDAQGAHDHLGWETYAGTESGASEANLTTLHESFHNELNNLTAFGFLLQVYALLAKADKEHGQYEAVFKFLVSRCREAHEIYATFISTTIMAEKVENRDREPGDLLKNHARYQRYYEQGRQLSADFQGNYLKEIALTAIIIICFQSRTICGTIFFVTVPDTIIRSAWRGLGRKRPAPKRSMSKRLAAVEIISIAQHASPNWSGQIDDRRPQL